MVGISSSWAAESAVLSDTNSVAILSEDDQSDSATNYQEPRYVLRSRLRKQARELRDRQRQQQQQQQQQLATTTVRCEV